MGPARRNSLHKKGYRIVTRSERRNRAETDVGESAGPKAKGGRSDFKMNREEILEFK